MLNFMWKPHFLMILLHSMEEKEDKPTEASYTSNAVKTYDLTVVSIFGLSFYFRILMLCSLGPC